MHVRTKRSTSKPPPNNREACVRRVRTNNSKAKRSENLPHRRHRLARLVLGRVDTRQRQLQILEETRHTFCRLCVPLIQYVE
jgi:hypothetical protein